MAHHHGSRDADNPSGDDRGCDSRERYVRAVDGGRRRAAQTVQRRECEVREQFGYLVPFVSVKAVTEIERLNNTLFALDLEDLPPPVLDEIVVAFHHFLEFLAQLFRHSLAPHHRLELRHAFYLKVCDESPITLAGEIRHYPHFAVAGLLIEFRHSGKLVNHRTHFARFAVHDFANQQHDSSLELSDGDFSPSAPARKEAANASLNRLLT